jgi:hypothetical protein
MWDESERVSRGMIITIMRERRSKGHTDHRERESEGTKIPISSRTELALK